MKSLLSTIIILIICTATVFLTRQGLTEMKSFEPDHERDLYLPEVAYLKFISLGFDGLIADLVLAKGLTYYGSHYYERNTFKFIHLKKIFMTAVEMDPRNREAFLMGNNILKTADPSTRSSIELLKRGMFYHPDFWKFPEMIGFNYYYTLDEPELAGKYYEMASGLHSVSDPLPGQSGSGKSPAPYVASLSGKFYEESGKYREALRILKKFYQTTQDKQLKKSFMDSYKQVLKRISFRNQYVHKHLDIIGRCIQLQTGGF